MNTLEIIKEPEVITYSLKEKGINSNNYYSDINEFKLDVVKRGECFNSLIIEFKTYLIENNELSLRTKEEYLFELLMLGVLWEEYAIAANGTNKIAISFLNFLYQIRSSSKKLKPYADYLRGYSFKFLFSKNKKDIEYSSKNLKKLIDWLGSTGEYKEEVKRFHSWFSFLKKKEDFNNNLFEVIAFAEWFKIESKKSLGKYTKNISNFLKTHQNKYKNKEDYIFCGRTESEYFMNMVGAEIMNEAFRPCFTKVKTKVVLLPACMRIHKDGICKAVKNDLDLICTGCNNECNINKYRKLGFQEGFDVRVIPHSSDFTRWLKTFAKEGNIGVVGVACILNLIQGGLELKDLEIPAQCILLDYCGCQNHWHEKGIVTDINQEKLLDIIKN